MISGLIPHRYAMALYKFAGDNGAQKSLYDVMKCVSEAFRSNPGLEKVLSNPFAKKEDKRRLLFKTAGENPGEDFERFVTLVLDHRREAFFRLMAIAYRDIYRRENHISMVRITTAIKFADSEIDKLKAVVERNFKDTSFEYHLSVDPAVIGGFVIDVDSVRMDASVRNELEQLRQNLLESV